jgi:hypothetical protein
VYRRGPPGADGCAGRGRAPRLRAAGPRALDGQRAADRRDEVALRYGPIYSLDAIRQRVRKTLPFRPLRSRSWQWTPVTGYRGRIPEAALCRLGEAQESHLFDRFVVAEPRYEDSGSQLVVDLWLLGLWEPISVRPTEAVIIAAWA